MIILVYYPNLKEDHYLENRDMNWVGYFTKINKKANLIYKKPLMGKVENPFYINKYKFIKTDILVFSNQQDITFYILTPTIELIEVCVLNTNNPSFVGLFIPAMCSLYIFEYMILLIINLSTFYVLYSSILLLLNSMSKDIFNINIENKLTTITNYSYNLLLLYLMLHSFYFLNFWLFFK